MMLINIMDKGLLPFSTDNYKSDRESLSQLPFSFILEKKYTMCDVCGLKYLSVEPTTVLFITIMDNASMEELVLQEQKPYF